MQKDKKTTLKQTILRTVIIILCTALLTGTMVVFVVIQGIIKEAPDIQSIDFAPSGYATHIYDADGGEIQELSYADSNRTAVSIEMIPSTLKDAIVAIEDSRFYRHNGIDIKGILRAALNGVMHGFHFTQGASTITQQLLKNNVFTSWTSEKTLEERIIRKVQEQYLAIELEKLLNSKEKILENYLNTINFGEGAYGVQEAAKTYFNKDVWDLTLGEAAVIAAIPQNPTRYDPIVYPGWNNERRLVVLKKMYKQGYITEDQRSQAENEDVYTAIEDAQMARKGQKAKPYTYFVDVLIGRVINDLVAQKGYSEAQAYHLLFSGGLNIYTTQDARIQAICDEVIGDPDSYPEDTRYLLDWNLAVRHKDGTEELLESEDLVKFYEEQFENFTLTFSSKEEGQGYIDKYKRSVLTPSDQIISEWKNYEPQPQASVVVMDQHTGYVKGLVGGRGQKKASLTLNRATGTVRQPGSTFKLLSAYAELLDTGAKTIGSIYTDDEYTYKNGEAINNSDRKHHGDMSLRKAIEESNNVVAVKAIDDAGINASFRRLIKFGFTTLNTENDLNQMLVLGGLYNGVSNLEVTAAYGAIANGGTRCRPMYYTRITDLNGNVILSNETEEKSVIGKDTAWILTDAMKGVMKNGTGKEALPTIDMPFAGKTGTTNDYKDLWMVGYSPYYTVGVWSGCDDSSAPVLNEKEPIYHKKIWKRIMTEIHDGLEKKDFSKPEEVIKEKVCAHSGYRPSASCSETITDYVSTRFLPENTCILCQPKEESENE